MHLRRALCVLFLLAGACSGSSTQSQGALTVTPASLALPPGGSAAVTVAFVSTVPNEVWTVSASGEPPGVTHTFASPTLQAGQDTQFTLSVAANAAPGTTAIHLSAIHDIFTPTTGADLSLTIDPQATGGGVGGGAGGGTGGSAGGGAGGGAPLQYTSAATIIVEPSDNGTGLLNAIKNARTSVHMTMYILSSTPIINALVAQKAAGHEVKVVLNQNFPGGAGSNAAAFTTLQNGGVSVVWAPSTFTLTHEKAVIIDGTTAWIMTMNAAATAPSNREYLAVDTDPADVAEADAIFAADFAGTGITPQGKLVVAPNNARATLVALAATATSTIDMEAEELSDYQVVNALAAAADRGVTVQVVLCDNAPSPSQTTSVALLKGHGAHLVTLASPYIHAKSLVVDGSRAYVGSENFTTSSLVYNRELGVLINTAAQVQKILSTSRTDFANGTAL